MPSACALRAGGIKCVAVEDCGGATCLNPAGMCTWFTSLSSDLVRGSQLSLSISITFCNGPFWSAKSAMISCTGRNVVESTHSSRYPRAHGWRSPMV